MVAMASQSDRLNTVLGHCVMRAAMPHVRGDNRLSVTYAAVKGAPKGSRVAAFIVLWAKALIDQERDDLAVTEYARWAAESESTVYRRLREFRELFPEYELPNDLARALIAASEARGWSSVDASVELAL